MKTYIGNYVNYFSSYDLAKAICFWVKEKEDELGFKSTPEWVSNFGEFISKSFIGNFLDWIYNKRKRISYIKIDKHDTWSLDNTLAMIILPALKQFKETFHSYPILDFKEGEDYDSESEDIDSINEKRWNDVLDKMIWSFEQILDDNNDEQFYTVKGELNDDSELFKDGTINWKVKPVFDTEAYKKHNAKIQEGLELFGRYYRNLWD